MQLAIEAHVVSARSVLCFLQRIGTTEVIRVLGPPLLIEPVLLFLATLGRATSLLALFESRMWMKPAPTVRTPSPREHGFPLQATSQAKKRNRGARKREKQKGKALLKPIRRRRKENQKAKEHGSNFGRLIRDQGVRGSNPLAPTILHFLPVERLDRRVFCNWARDLRHRWRSSKARFSAVGLFPCDFA